MWKWPGVGTYLVSVALVLVLVFAGEPAIGAVIFSLALMPSSNSPSPLSLAFSACALALASLFNLAFSPPLSKAFLDSSCLFASASLVFSSKAFRRAMRAAVWALTVSSEGGDGLGSRGTRWAMPFFFFFACQYEQWRCEEKINLSLTLSNKICRLFLHQCQGKP